VLTVTMQSMSADMCHDNTTAMSVSTTSARWPICVTQTNITFDFYYAFCHGEMFSKWHSNIEARMSDSHSIYLLWQSSTGRLLHRRGPATANDRSPRRVWVRWVTHGLAVWCSSDALVSINAVALNRARLVLGWVTAFGQVNCLIT